MAGSPINTHATEAARLLIRDTEQLARAVTAQFFKETPELLERYGERGRDKCLQDMRYNVEHLIPAVEMRDASMFTRYVEWLGGLLRARNVPTNDLLRCLELLRNEVFARYDKSEVDAINAILDPAIAMTEPR